MSRCLSEAEIQDSASLSLGPIERAGIEEHLRVCAHCAARLRELCAVQVEQADGSSARAAMNPLRIAAYIESNVSLEDFLTSLSQSGLLSPPEIAALRQRSTGDPAGSNLTSVIDWLIQEHKLTHYQAQVLARGERGILILGNYIVLEKLGQGGMGTVFKARHRRMNRLVALKVLPAALASVPEAVVRFQREVQAVASLHHANIAAAYDADEAAGVHFLVMEYVEGPTLAACVKARGALPLAAVVGLTAQAARGLAAAHAAGIVHRDVKPSNLMVNRQGVLKVLDLGLAQMHGEQVPEDPVADVTQTGRVMGTVDYMAPEQARNAKGVDHRADLYSLGCTFHFLATGAPPAPPGSAAEKLLWHQTQNPPPLASVCPQATPRLEALLARLMSKRPEDRPDSMELVATELDVCSADFPAGEANLAIGDIALTHDHNSSTLDGSGLIHATHRDIGPTLVGTLQAPIVLPLAPSSRSRWLVYSCGIVGAIAIAAILALPFLNGKQQPALGPPVFAATDAALIVEVTGGPAEVFINGQWRGHAGESGVGALELQVPPGEQFVQIKREGFTTHEEWIVAQSGKPQRVAARLSRIGSLATRPSGSPPADAPYENLLTWVFRNGGSVVAITGQGQQLSLSSADARPDEPLEIIAIRLDGTGVRNAELANLAQAPGLRELSLASTTIGDEGLVHLQSLRQLTHLDLAQTNVTNAGLAHLARLGQLVELNLQKTKVTDPGLARLTGLSNLQRLYLADTAVTDVGIEQLSSLPALKRVVLYGTGLSEEGHRALASARPELEIAWDGADVQRLTALRLLDKGVTLRVVDRAGRTHENLRGRESLPQGRVLVQRVDASSAVQFRDEDLKQLALLPEIESLSLAGASITPDGLSRLHGLTTLKALELGPLRVPESAVAALRTALANCQIDLKEPPDAEVARMMIAAGGKVTVVTLQGLTVADIADETRLPATGFVVRSANGEGQSMIDDGALARLSDLPDLESLFLGGTSITDEGVAQLAACRALRELSLSETAVTAAGVGALARLPALERLYLAKTKIGSEGGRRAAALPQLTHLSLQGVQLADDDVALLKRLERLEWLDVSGTPLTDAAAIHLSQLGKLRQLNVGGTALSDAGLEELSAALKDCGVSGDPPDPQRLAARWFVQNKGTVTLESGTLASVADLPRDACRVLAVDLAGLPTLDRAQVVKHLACCTDAVSLNLGDANLREADLACLASFAALRDVRLVNLAITDTTLKRLAGHDKLEVLDLSGTRITGSGLANLAKAAELKQLLLANTPIDERFLADLTAFPKLEVLSVAAGRSVSDVGLASVEKLKALKSLDLRGTKITDAGMDRIAGLTSLESLDLEATGITSAGVGKLTGLTNLRRINLARTGVADDVTATLAQLKQLKSINLARTTVTLESIRQLQTDLPGCAIIAPAAPPRDPNSPSGVDDSGVDRANGGRAVR